MHVSANAEENAGVFHGNGSNFFAGAWRQIVTGVCARVDVDPGGIDVFDGSRGGIVEIGDCDFEIRLVVGGGSGIVNHGFDADLIAFFDAIAEAGNEHPVGEFPACAENVLFLIRAEKIGAVFVPEGNVMKNGTGNGVAGSVDQFRMVGK